MKTTLKLSFAFLMTIMFSNFGVAQEETWSPAAERSTNTIEETETYTGLAAESNDDQFAIEENKDTETSAKKNKRKNRSKFRSGKKGRVKTIINTVKEYKKNKKKRDGGAMVVLLVILAIILPPLAVGIYEGITGRFWLVLVLWLIGWALFGWLWASVGGIIGLCALAAIICALLIVLGVW